MKKFLLSLAAVALLAAPASAQLLQKKASAFGQKKELPAWAQKQLRNDLVLQHAPIAMENQKLL